MGGYEIYEKIRTEKGLRDADITRMTGISSGTLSDWKKGRYELKAEKLKKIAEVMDVSVDMLTGAKSAYYTDETIRQLAEFLAKNPDYRSLFDAAMRLKRKDIAFVKEFIERFGDDS